MAQTVLAKLVSIQCQLLPQLGSILTCRRGDAAVRSQLCTATPAQGVLQIGPGGCSSFPQVLGVR